MMDIRETNRQVIERFRSGAEVPGMHRERLLLLTTTGARTGRRHTVPMMFVRVEGRLLVIASNAGATKVPAWYRNLAADPRVTVEIDKETFAALARPLEGPERDEAWREITAQYPFFVEHAAKARRTIPVVELSRA